MIKKLKKIILSFLWEHAGAAKNCKSQPEIAQSQPEIATIAAKNCKNSAVFGYNSQKLQSFWTKKGHFLVEKQPKRTSENRF